VNLTYNIHLLQFISITNSIQYNIIQKETNIVLFPSNIYAFTSELYENNYFRNIYSNTSYKYLVINHI